MYKRVPLRLELHVKHSRLYLKVQSSQFSKKFVKLLNAKSEILTLKEIDSGFVRSPVEEYDVCRNCIPCAPHTWIANSKKKIKASDPILKKKTSVEPIG